MKLTKPTDVRTKTLLRAFVALRDEDEAWRFIRDLLTEAEIEEFGNRLAVAQMLTDGVSYSRIEKEVGMSSTTIARIARWLSEGLCGYSLILNRLQHHTHPRCEAVRGV